MLALYSDQYAGTNRRRICGSGSGGGRWIGMDGQLLDVEDNPQEVQDGVVEHLPRRRNPRNFTLHRLLGDRTAFPFPKSLYAVRDTLLTVVRDRPNALIPLDFFAGSGTTLHATALINARTVDHVDASWYPTMRWLPRRRTGPT